jgi:outer membrane lipoprotein
MKKILLAALVCLLLFSCTSILRKDLLDSGSKNVPLSDMMKSPDAYKGKLYILGGTVINTKTIDKGLILEAAYVPVDSYGYVKQTERTKDRYLAICPKEQKDLCAETYARGSDVTIAGTFVGTQPVEIKGATYAYPMFKVDQIYLWPEKALLEKGDLPALHPWEFPHQHPTTDNSGQSWRYYGPVR